MVKVSGRIGLRRSLLVVMVLSLLLLPAVPASADVVEVTGSAFGYFTDVSLFEGASEQRGPDPTVSLEVDASNSPQDASVESADAVYGPAVIFRAGQMEVHAEGSLGAGGSVVTSSSVQGDPDPDRRPGPLLFDAIDSTCTADEDGVVTTTTVTGGVVETRYDVDTQEPLDSEEVPVSPEPGYTVEGTIDHVGDSFRIIFNEQTTNPDGSVTVNGARMELLGPTAVGEVIVGQSVCGVDDEVTTGTVAGTVTDAESGAPLPGATVSAGGRQATTGSDGAYALAGLAPGEHTVTADADGYNPVSQEATVAVAATTTADFALRTAAGDGAIAGMVANADTTDPVEGAQVSVTGAGGVVAGTAVTGEDGSYTVLGLEPGTYTVTASLFRYEPASVEVTVNAGQTSTVDMAITPPPPPPGTTRAGSGSLAGTETAPPGASEETFVGPPCFFNASRTVNALRGVGTYHGWDATGGQVVYEATIDEGAGETTYADGPLQVQIENTEDYYHGPGGTHGTVADVGSPPPEGACMEVSVPIPAEVRIFADGHVHAAGAPDEPCVGEGSFARGSLADHMNFSAEWVLSGDCVVVDDDGASGLVPTGSGHDVVGVSEPCFEHPCSHNIRVDYEQFLLQFGAIAGSVTDADTGEPIAGATVTADGAEATTGADGGYELGGLTPGAYTVTADADGYLPLVQGDVTVAGGATTTMDLALDVQPATWLTLVSVDEADVGEEVSVTAAVTIGAAPAEGVAVGFAVEGPGAAIPGSGSVDTNAAGDAVFAFAVDAEGSYTVTATAVADGEELSASHTMAFAVPEPPSLELAGPSSAERGQDFTMLATLTDGGDPVEGVAVDFAAPAGFLGTASPTSGTVFTDANGEAALTFTAESGIFVTVTAEASYADVDLSASQAVLFTEPPPPPELVLSGPDAGEAGTETTVTATVSGGRNPVGGVDVSFAVEGPGEIAPASGSTETDAGGEATFAFSADAVGDYTVTATATHDGEELSATHTVALTEPVTRVTVAGPHSARVDHDVTATARVTLAGEPVAGVAIDFGIDGPGEASPHAHSATTDAAGQATVTFTGDTEGDYAVTASGTHNSHDFSDTRTIIFHTDAFQRVDAFEMDDEDRFEAAVIDPAGDYAYYGTNTSPAHVLKVDLETFEPVDRLTLPEGETHLRSAVIDPDGHYAYFGMASQSAPGGIVKIDLTTFARVDSIILPAGEEELRSAVIDPAGDFAYFGTSDAPGRVIKIDLEAFRRVETIVLEDGEYTLRSAAIDPAGDYAYFGTWTSPVGQVVKIDLNTFERVGVLALEEGQPRISSAVIDPTGEYAYFGTYHSAEPEGWVVKVELATFEQVDALRLEDRERRLTTAIMDPVGRYAYFGMERNAGWITQVDLATFERVRRIELPRSEDQPRAVVVHPSGEYAYYSVGWIPAGVVKIALSTPPGAVAGQVVDASTGGVIPGATVTVVGAEGAERSATTDATEGIYTIADVAPGDYTVTAEADLYQPATEDITVTAGVTSTADFALEPVPGTIAGHVAHFANEAPIPAATVSVTDSGGSVIAETTTDSGGTYLVEGLTPGDYEVTVSAAGYVSMSVSTTVTSAETSTVDFGLQPGGGPPRTPGRPADPGPPPGKGPPGGR